MGRLYPADQLALAVRQPPKAGDAPLLAHGARLCVYTDSACTARVNGLTYEDGTPIPDDVLIVTGLHLPRWIAPGNPETLWLRQEGSSSDLGSPTYPVTAATPAGPSFTYVRSVPAATWPITHPLPLPPQVLLLAPDGEEVRADLSYPGPGQVTVTFAAPFAGTAYLFN